MPTGKATLSPETRLRIAEIFARLDYEVLGRVYCDEGGEAFWRARRAPTRRLGSRIAAALRARLRPGGRSLYVGAGVAEIPVLAMETLELGRSVEAFNLRRPEVSALNQACLGVGLSFHAADACTARGRFDHLWLVSVLNDPECCPELSEVTYGRSHPASLDLKKFAREHRTVKSLVARCMAKLSTPGLVTTTTEEAPWVVAECRRRDRPCVAERRSYPTALVGDPVCFLHVS